MLMSRRNMQAISSSPYDHKVLYVSILGASKGIYVNTPIVQGGTPTRYEQMNLSCKFTKFGAANAAIWCKRKNLKDKSFSLFKMGSTMRFDNDTTQTALDYNVTFNKRLTFKVLQNAITITNETGITEIFEVPSTEMPVFTSPIILGGSKKDTTSQTESIDNTADVDVYSFNYSTRFGTLARQFFSLIPVRKNGIGYLYDEVSKTLIGGVGGDLIAGPDID